MKLSICLTVALTALSVAAAPFVRPTVHLQEHNPGAPTVKLIWKSTKPRHAAVKYGMDTAVLRKESHITTKVGGKYVQTVPHITGDISETLKTTSFIPRSNLPRITLNFLMNRVAKTFAKKIIWGAMEKDLLQSVKRNIGSATDGSRAWPKTTQDKELGVRLDWGEKFQEDGHWFRNLVLQFNKDAKSPAINEVAKKGTHAKRAIVKVPMSTDGKELHPEVTVEDFKPVIAEGV